MVERTTVRSCWKRKVGYRTVRMYNGGIFVNIRRSCEHTYRVVYLNTSRGSSFCNQPLIPAAVESGFSFNQKSCPPFPVNRFSGPLPRSYELGEGCPRGCRGGGGTIRRSSGAAGVGDTPAGCRLCPCVWQWGAFCSSVHTSWLPTLTEGRCLQVVPWEPVGLKFELVIIPFIKMKT